MNDMISRILMFFGGFVLAFGSSLSTLPGGAELTLVQIGQVPLLAWVLATGAGIVSALDGKILNRGGKPAS